VATALDDVAIVVVEEVSEQQLVDEGRCPPVETG
jgi:hypothetical protein